MNMNKRRIMLLLILTILTLSMTGCVYHKPEFIGQILDKETKQPLEGAVVVAVYNKQAMGCGAGAISEIIDVREALTNSEGRFRIPSYTTSMMPIFTRDSGATFIVFKPGYASLSGLNLEEYLSKKTGKAAELPLLYMSEKIGLAPGVVELPKVRSREARLSAAGIGGFHSKDLPLLNKTLKEEEKYLGIPERE